MIGIEGLATDESFSNFVRLAQMSRAKGDFNTRQMLLGVQNGTKWSLGKMVT